MVKIGHAALSESGSTGWDGKAVAGDQTGAEVLISNWYDKPWTVCFRPKNTAVAEKSAAACEQLCSCELVGYDQSQRNSLHEALRANGYDIQRYIASGQPTETDCSAFQQVLAIIGGISQLEYTGNAMTTSGMEKRLTATGQYEVLKDSKYLSSADYLKRGDVLLAKGHTAMVLSNGSKSGGGSMAFKTITPKQIINVVAQNASQVPAHRNGGVRFIVVHYLGVPNADNHNLYGGGYGGHYYVSRKGEIYQATNPQTDVVWQCGGGLQGEGGHAFFKICNNYNSIGIENGVCFTDKDVKSPSASDNRWYFTTETQESLVYLVSKLMDEYGVPFEHVIRHYDVTGKCCPVPYVLNNHTQTSWTWDEFKARLAEYRKSGGYTIVDTSGSGSTSGTGSTTSTKWYRVRKAWNDSKSQLGAYQVLENAIKECPVGYKVYDYQGKVVYSAEAPKPAGLQATELKGLTEAQAVAKMGAYFTADQKKTGILASVSMAQFILESGYGKTELAQNANNVFGMKAKLSGNTWAGSVWDGKSIYTKKTKEEYTPGVITEITADFRKYPCVEDSISDHGAYLLNAKNGTKLRYEGLKGCTDYRKAVEIIKAGGYATASNYVQCLCNIIEKWHLTQYDIKQNTLTDVPFWVNVIVSDLNYRTEPSMNGAVRGQTGKGSFTIVEVKDGWGKLKSGAGWIWLMNPDYCRIGAHIEADKPKYPALPFFVEVLVSDLNLRSAPSMSGSVLGQTGKGTFTISEVQNGWGRLISGAGWIYLDNPAYVRIGEHWESKVPYTVRVKITDLNIRKGPGTGYAVNRVCPPGSYTIVEERPGAGASMWGRLKSGAGWISLDFVEKV